MEKREREGRRKATPTGRRVGTGRAGRRAPDGTGRLSSTQQLSVNQEKMGTSPRPQRFWGSTAPEMSAGT